MKKIITADKTETFLNEEVNESYHSYSGAVEEAVKKYVEPCEIKELAKKGEIKITVVATGFNNGSTVQTKVSQQRPNLFDNPSEENRHPRHYILPY